VVHPIAKPLERDDRQHRKVQIGPAMTSNCARLPEHWASLAI
jgi:hypothetical protein